MYFELTEDVKKDRLLFASYAMDIINYVVSCQNKDE